MGRVGSNVVKFVFPRGDATSLLFSFDAAGRITGVGVGGMAGAIDPPRRRLFSISFPG